jgi:hypothetical protein
MARLPHPLVLVALLPACGPGDTGSSTGSTTAAITSTGDTTEPGTTEAASTAAPTTGTIATTGTTASDTTGAPALCGEQSCQADEVCVLTCCGGPPPGCSEPNRGMCEGGQDPVPSQQCPSNPCAGPLCCLPVDCTPDPPFCVAPEMLSCNGNSCSIASCFGNLNGDRLECQCA